MGSPYTSPKGHRKAREAKSRAKRKQSQEQTRAEPRAGKQAQGREEPREKRPREGKMGKVKWPASKGETQIVLVIPLDATYAKTS